MSKAFSDELPPELWYRIALFVSEFDDRRTLLAMTITCRVICETVRPILFEHVRFTGLPASVIQVNKNYWASCLNDVVGLSCSPLRFLIRRVTLVTFGAGHTDGRVWQFGEKVFAMVGSLPDLQQVDCVRVVFKTSMLQQVCHASLESPIKSLPKLRLRGCTFSPDDTVEYKIGAVQLYEHTNLEKTNGFAGEMIAWSAMTVLNPAVLTALTLHAPMVFPKLGPLLLDKPAFQNLRQLELLLPTDDQCCTFLVPFLERCTRIRQLSLLKPGKPISLARLSTYALPNLTEFTGPPSIATSLVAERSLSILRFRAVRITGDIIDGWRHSRETYQTHDAPVDLLEVVDVLNRMGAQTRGAMREVAVYSMTADVQKRPQTVQEIRKLVPMVKFLQYTGRFVL